MRYATKMPSPNPRGPKPAICGTLTKLQGLQGLQDVQQTLWITALGKTRHDDATGINFLPGIHNSVLEGSRVPMTLSGEVM